MKCRSSADGYAGRGIRFGRGALSCSAATDTLTYAATILPEVPSVLGFEAIPIRSQGERFIVALGRATILDRVEMHRRNVTDRGPRRFKKLTVRLPSAWPAPSVGPAVVRHTHRRSRFQSQVRAQPWGTLPLPPRVGLCGQLTPSRASVRR